MSVRAMRAFIDALPARSRKTFKDLDSPLAIQEYLDSVAYSTDPIYRSPVEVLRDRKAHCFDGGLLAAAAFRNIGLPPLIVDLRAVRDDDHLLAVFRKRGMWGAVAKSNFVGLRWREPVYRSVRELVMSYFESFYNLVGEKSLRSYVGPLDVGTLDHLNWMESAERIEGIVDRLDEMRLHTVITPAMARSLAPVDKRSFKAGMQGAKKAGIYKP